MNPALPLVGRILLTLLFFVAAYNKLMNVAGTAGYFGKLGLPMPDLLVWIVIAVELGGALLILIGWQTRWVAWGLAIFTVATGVIGHKFWVDPSQTTQFLKNLAIAGGFIMLAYAGPGRLSVDKA
jgi:putative oxidoreductase